jgi:hypothetical protein
MKKSQETKTGTVLHVKIYKYMHKYTQWQIGFRDSVKFKYSILSYGFLYINIKFL